MANVWTVFWIRDVHPGSEFLHPGSEFFPSRIRTDLLQDGGKTKKRKNIDHQDPRTIPNICHLPELPTFPLAHSFKCSNLAMHTVDKLYN
jgi:hypothetical protein